MLVGFTVSGLFLDSCWQKHADRPELLIKKEYDDDGCLLRFQRRLVTIVIFTKMVSIIILHFILLADCLAGFDSCKSSIHCS